MQIAEISDLSKLRTYWHGWGPSRMAQVLTFNMANRVIYLEILRVLRLRLENVAEHYLNETLPFEFRPLQPSEIESYANDRTFDLHKFYRSALAHEDICFAALDGEKLVNYGWYSRYSTPITGEFRACFHDRYVYMHHGFTHPEYRGRHVYSHTMARALNWLNREAPTELVSVVSFSNVGAFKSTRRLGYEQIGTIYIGGRLNTYLVYVDSGCRQHGFWVAPTGAQHRSVYLRSPISAGAIASPA